jgi:hypothetical protein
MFHHPNAGQNYDMKIANRSLENSAKFKYMRTKITNKNLIQEEIKRQWLSKDVPTKTNTHITI